MTTLVTVLAVTALVAGSAVVLLCRWAVRARERDALVVVRGQHRTRQIQAEASARLFAAAYRASASPAVSEPSRWATGVFVEQRPSLSSGEED